jgi:hypothetical protein
MPRASVLLAAAHLFDRGKGEPVGAPFLAKACP